MRRSRTDAHKESGCGRSGHTSQSRSRSLHQCSFGSVTPGIVAVSGLGALGLGAVIVRGDVEDWEGGNKKRHENAHSTAFQEEHNHNRRPAHRHRKIAQREER